MPKCTLTYIHNGKEKTVEGELARIDYDPSAVLAKLVPSSIRPIDKPMTVPELQRHYGYERVSVQWEDRKVSK